jgi:hypothetical protein
MTGEKAKMTSFTLNPESLIATNVLHANELLRVDVFFPRTVCRCVLCMYVSPAKPSPPLSVPRHHTGQHVY